MENSKIMIGILVLVAIFLFVFAGNVINGYFTYDVTEDFVEVSTWEDMYNVRNDPGGNYILINDLTPETEGYDTYVNIEEGWVPIEDFEGTFDGDDYIIEGLYVNVQFGTNFGLFSNIKNGGQVLNLGIINSDVSGGFYSGLLVGTNKGEIQNSYTIGFVYSEFGAGGLAGRNEGTIINSYSEAEVSGQDRIGGLTGLNSGTIQNSYAAGSTHIEEIENEVYGDEGLIYSFTSQFAEPDQETVYNSLYNKGIIVLQYSDFEEGIKIRYEGNQSTGAYSDFITSLQEGGMSHARIAEIEEKNISELPGKFGVESFCGKNPHNLLYPNDKLSCFELVLDKGYVVEEVGEHGYTEVFIITSADTYLKFADAVLGEDWLTAGNLDSTLTYKTRYVETPMRLASEFDTSGPWTNIDVLDRVLAKGVVYSAQGRNAVQASVETYLKHFEAVGTPAADMTGAGDVSGPGYALSFVSQFEPGTQLKAQAYERMLDIGIVRIEIDENHRYRIAVEASVETYLKYAEFMSGSGVIESRQVSDVPAFMRIDNILDGLSDSEKDIRMSHFLGAGYLVEEILPSGGRRLFSLSSVETSLKFIDAMGFGVGIGIGERRDSPIPFATTYEETLLSVAEEFSNPIKFLCGETISGGMLGHGMMYSASGGIKGVQGNVETYLKYAEVMEYTVPVAQAAEYNGEIDTAVFGDVSGPGYIFEFCSMFEPGSSEKEDCFEILLNSGVVRHESVGTEFRLDVESSVETYLKFAAAMGYPSEGNIQYELVGRQINFPEFYQVNSYYEGLSDSERLEAIEHKLSLDEGYFVEEILPNGDVRIFAFTGIDNYNQFAMNTGLTLPGEPSEGVFSEGLTERKTTPIVFATTYEDTTYSIAEEFPYEFEVGNAGVQLTPGYNAYLSRLNDMGIIYSAQGLQAVQGNYDSYFVKYGGVFGRVGVAPVEYTGNNEESIVLSETWEPGYILRTCSMLETEGSEEKAECIMLGFYKGVVRHEWDTNAQRQIFETESSVETYLKLVEGMGFAPSQAPAASINLNVDFEDENRKVTELPEFFRDDILFEEADSENLDRLLDKGYVIQELYPNGGISSFVFASIETYLKYVEEMGFAPSQAPPAEYNGEAQSYTNMYVDFATTYEDTFFRDIEDFPKADRPESFDRFTDKGITYATGNINGLEASIETYLKYARLMGLTLSFPSTELQSGFNPAYMGSNDGRGAIRDFCSEMEPTTHSRGQCIEKLMDLGIVRYEYNQEENELRFETEGSVDTYLKFQEVMAMYEEEFNRHSIGLQVDYVGIPEFFEIEQLTEGLSSVECGSLSQTKCELIYSSECKWEIDTCSNRVPSKTQMMESLMNIGYVVEKRDDSTEIRQGVYMLTGVEQFLKYAENFPTASDLMGGLDEHVDFSEIPVSERFVEICSNVSVEDRMECISNYLDELNQITEEGINYTQSSVKGYLLYLWSIGAPPAEFFGTSLSEPNLFTETKALVEEISLEESKEENEESLILTNEIKFSGVEDEYIQILELSNTEPNEEIEITQENNPEVAEYITITLSTNEWYSVGGLSGSNFGTIENSFWNIITFETEKGVGDGDEEGVYGRTTSEMKNVNTYLNVGWDIATRQNWDGEVWHIDNTRDYPRLGDFEDVDSVLDGTPSGPSRPSAPTVPDVDEEEPEIDEPVEKVDIILSLGEEITFYVRRVEHRINLIELGTDYAVIEIFSEPVRLTIQVGDSREVDITGDGVNDIIIHLDSVDLERAYFRVEPLVIEPVEEIIDEPVEEIIDEPVEEKMDREVMVAIILGIIAIILASGIIYKYYRGQNLQKKTKTKKNKPKSKVDKFYKDNLKKLKDVQKEIKKK